MRRTGGRSGAAAGRPAPARRAGGRPAGGRGAPGHPRRCEWARTPLGIAYHDREWGVPVRDDRRLFEFLILEGAQAGLSWETILGKRERYRQVFDGFDPAKVAGYGARKMEALLADPGIVRNRAKVAAAIGNAQAFLAVQREFGSFADYLWGFAGGRPRRRAWRRPAEVPARTAESDGLSRDLKRRGFRFVGSTICYAFMQAVGLVNDHTVDCFRHREMARRDPAPRRRPRHVPSDGGPVPLARDPR